GAKPVLQRHWVVPGIGAAFATHVGAVVPPPPPCVAAWQVCVAVFGTKPSSHWHTLVEPGTSAAWSGHVVAPPPSSTHWPLWHWPPAPQSAAVAQSTHVPGCAAEPAWQTPAPHWLSARHHPPGSGSHF